MRITKKLVVKVRLTILRMFGTLGCKGRVPGDVRMMTRTGNAKIQILKIPPVFSDQVCKKWALGSHPNGWPNRIRDRWVSWAVA